MNLNKLHLATIQEFSQMTQIDFIARALTGIIACGFLIAAIFNILDYFIVKLLLFGMFSSIVVGIFFSLLTNENHPEVS